MLYLKTQGYKTKAFLGKILAFPNENKLLVLNRSLLWNGFIFSVCVYVLGAGGKREGVIWKFYCIISRGPARPRNSSLIYSLFKNVYLFLRTRERERKRERAHKKGRGRERGRHRILSRLQALSCQHRAQRGAQTHKP